MGNLQEARIRKHWSKKQLQDESGVTWDTITKAERGEPIRDYLQQKLADALGAKRTDLFPAPEPSEATA
jgi:transcriptional regulator with XRE-family HTH domain